MEKNLNTGKGNKNRRDKRGEHLPTSNSFNKAKMYFLKLKLPKRNSKRYSKGTLKILE